MMSILRGAASNVRKDIVFDGATIGHQKSRVQAAAAGMTHHQCNDCLLAEIRQVATVSGSDERICSNVHRSKKEMD